MKHALTPTRDDFEDSIDVDGPLVVARYASRNPDATILRSIAAVEGLVAKGVRPAQLVIMRAGAAPPGQEARNALAASRVRLSGKLVGVAYVVEGDGFGAAAHRTALASLALAQRAEHPVKVFTTSGEARSWLSSLLGTGAFR